MYTRDSGGETIGRIRTKSPEVNLFFARPEEIKIDTSVLWTMVKERTGFYEVSRYTMLALQKLIREP